MHNFLGCDPIFHNEEFINASKLTLTQKLAFLNLATKPRGHYSVSCNFLLPRATRALTHTHACARQLQLLADKRSRANLNQSRDVQAIVNNKVIQVWSSLSLLTWPWNKTTEYTHCRFSILSTAIFLTWFDQFRWETCNIRATHFSNFQSGINCTKNMKYSSLAG